MIRSRAGKLVVAFAIVVGCHEAAGATRGKLPPRQKVAKALNAILPEIQLRGANLREAVAFLSERAGVSIIIDPLVYTQAARPAEPEGTEKKSEGEVSAGGKAPSGEVGGITLHLKNVPLKVVLKYILRYKKLRYIVEDYAIVIVPIETAVPEEMTTEIFSLKAGSFEGISPMAQGSGRPLGGLPASGGNEQGLQNRAFRHPSQ